MRAAVLNSFKIEEKATRYSKFMEQFPHLEKIEEKYFFSQISNLLLFLRKKKWPYREKLGYIKNYGSDKWDKVEENNKTKHSLRKCNECLVKNNENNTFPTAAGHRKVKKIAKKQTLISLLHLNRP